jgi:DNA-binding response OmpR family regulator
MQILLVDDEDDALAILTRMLRSEGHRVDGCADAKLALTRLEANTYDVMITDLTMPGMSGLDLVVAARRLQVGLHCIIASGHDAPAQGEPAETKWITKPLDIEELLALIEPA